MLLCGVLEGLSWSLEKMSSFIESFRDFGKDRVALSTPR